MTKMPMFKTVSNVAYSNFKFVSSFDIRISSYFDKKCKEIIYKVLNTCLPTDRGQARPP